MACWSMPRRHEYNRGMVSTTSTAAHGNPSGEQHLPRIAVTLGDVAGIGPEIILAAWRDPLLHAHCQPIVIGDASLLKSLADTIPGSPEIAAQDRDGSVVSGPEVLVCVEGSDVAVHDLEPGRVHAAAGQAAYDYLVRAIDLATAGEVDAIVTMPLNKEGLHAAGLQYPGHTEILAARTNTRQFGMMLYRHGLAVVHVTLHTALRDVFAQITQEAIVEKIGLLAGMLQRLGQPVPRLGVAALNPHAGDGGIFGDEESRIIRPAVETALTRGIDVSGPWPADTLFVRAAGGELDGVVAMYHDQGHIALKLLGWKQAVNITVGLPIIRTSVAHGTGYDIVRTGQADPTSFLEAVLVAAKLAATKRHPATIQ